MSCHDQVSEFATSPLKENAEQRLHTADVEDLRRCSSTSRWGRESMQELSVNRILDREVDLRDATNRIHRHFTFTEDVTDHTTTADFTNLPSEPQSSQGSTVSCVTARRDREAVPHFNQQDDVSSFNSCIQPTPENHRLEAPPRRSGPCSADLLRRILLFVDVSSRGDIIQIGSVCRFWHYHTNFAPHWSAFRKIDWSSRTLNLPKSVRTTVVKPKMVSREEYVEEKKLLQQYRRNDEIISRARYVRWCAALGIVVGVLLSVNYLIAFCMGYFPTSFLSSDTSIGMTTFLVMLVLSLLEVAVVVVPLGGSGGLFSQNGMGRMSRVLSWAELLVSLSLVFGIIIALSFSRVRGIHTIIRGTLFNMTMSAACEYYPSPVPFPSFVALPARLSDIRWRPLTTDRSEQQYIPYCISDSCFSLLYFDSAYASPAFDTFTGYEQRFIGSYSALGFNVFSSFSGVNDKRAKRVNIPWCHHVNHTQIIALSEKEYQLVVREVNEDYPTEKYWLDPTNRTTSYSSITYKTIDTSTFGRAETSSGIESVWVQNSLWTDNYVPLLSTSESNNEYYVSYLQHFQWYAYSGIIITASLWLVMVLAQCIFKNATIGLLGITTCVTVFFLNPISMIIAGAVCVNAPGFYVMCSPAAGGALIGGGISLIFLVLVIYFSL